MNPPSIISECPGCQAIDSELFLTVPRAPVSCGQLFPTKDAAIQAGKCKLEIAYCRQCSHIWNAAYEDASTELYNEHYYSSFAASSQGREYQENLANDLDRIVNLSGKTVLEIGCGDGFFLKTLHGLGARAIGVEPSSTYHVAKAQPGVEVYPETFGFNGPVDIDSSVDVVVMRHVLEHLASPSKALEALNSCSTDGSGPQFLLLEVPNALQLLKENLFFDFYNDHVQYFSYGSLARLLQSVGWLPVASFGGNTEFLTVICISRKLGAEAAANSNSECIPPDSDDFMSVVKKFGQDFKHWKQRLRELLTEHRRVGHRVAVWGAGARGVALLSGIDLPDDSYAYVVDSDANKHGKYLPVVHQPVFPPDRISQDPVDCVLVTSYTYFDEIAADLAWFRSAGGKVIQVYPSPVVV